MPWHSDERDPSEVVPDEAHRHSILPIDPDPAPDDPGEPSRTHQPAAHVHRARQHDVVVAIASGGFLGAIARYVLGLSWPVADGRSPWAMRVVNITGSFLLGVTLTVLLDRANLARRLRPLLCVGFVGSWTTMSSFVVGADLLVRGGHLLTALVYVTATVVLGLSLAARGTALGRRLDRNTEATWASP